MGEARNEELLLWCWNSKFSRSLYIVGRGVLTPYFVKTLLYCLPIFFFQFCPPHCHLQPLSPLFFLLSCFFGWMSGLTKFDVLFYLMIIWMYKCWALWFQLSFSFFKFRKQHWLIEKLLIHVLYKKQILLAA